MGTGDPFPGGKERPWRDTDHPHLEPKSIMSRSYITSPPWRLHDLVGQLYFLLLIADMLLLTLYMKTVMYAFLFSTLCDKFSFRQTALDLINLAMLS
jgi:hypothetical protein